ncbi:MAG: acyl-CoA thioester hydrolase/BAAT C-terminal domain-containing protein [Flavobacterium sp.]|uniref:dienelactone hydrolase family protein n=1 Tax=Flavobacterium sp. TaxID=239 RepID=UPI003266E810
MKKIIILILVCKFFYSNAQEKINFSSLDGIKITADLYKINDTSNYIVLCHLAEHSRGEYKETAVKLNKLGFNCLAIDTRTGNEVFGIKNQTHIEAINKKKGTEYLDSEQDIIAAINFTDSINNNKGVILLGSSFSASLALKIATTHKKVKAVLAFSPGEYFGDKLNLKNTIKKLNKPVFVTSSKEESSNLKLLIENIKSKNKTQFIPIGKGAHGSIALWPFIENNEEYWTATIKFLKSVI